MATRTELELLEKIIRAKVKLEGMKRQHATTCMVDMDPDYTGPCRCGNTDTNTKINDVLEELKIT